MNYTIKDILRMEVAPALGCTEPTAVALCAAAAKSLLSDKKIDKLEIWVDSNIYKNGMAVSIPGAEGSLGIDMAAAMGVFGGDASRKLEVLGTIAKEDVKAAKQFVKEGKAKINLLEKQEGLYIRACLHAGSESAEAVIQDLHDNIVSLSKDGKVVESHPLLSVT